MASAKKLIAGDNTLFKITCKDQADAVKNLTGLTVQYIFSIDGAAALTKTMTVTSAANGEAEYRYLDTDLSAGKLVGEVRLTDGSSNEATSVNQIERDVRARLS